MPFLQMNPQGVRLTPSPTASNSPTATTNGSAPLNTLVDTGTATNLPGMVAWYKDTDGQISVLAYAIAQASIPYASPLMKAAGNLTTATGVASTRVKSGYDTNNVAVMTATQSGYSGYFAGIAAGSVSNTGAYFWRYISGFVPEAKSQSGMTSGALIYPNATIVASLTTNATSTNATTQIPVGFSVGAGPAGGGLTSIALVGWYM